MVTAFHHIGCLVHNIDDAIADYTLLHPGAELSERYVIAEQLVQVQFLTIGATNIEFVQPLSEESSLYRMLKKNAGFYHIGVYTNDIDAEIARLEAAGYRPINKFKSEAFQGRWCAFLYNLEMHLIELIQNDPAA